MRRKKPLKVSVKAPSRGLVTRFPSELADLMEEKDIKRTFVEAQNVRFEDGVVACAPGYEKVDITSGTISNLLDDCVGHFRFDESAAPYVDQVSANNFTETDSSELGHSFPSIDTSGKLGNAIRFGTTIDQGLSQFGTPYGFTGSFSITGWFKINTDADPIRIVGRGGATDSPQSYDDFASIIATSEMNYEVVYEGNDVTFSVRDTSGTVTSCSVAGPISTGAWHFFCARHSTGATIHLRVDSTSSSASHTTGVDCPLEDLFTIGILSTDIASDLSLDSLSLFDVALTNTQVDALYNSGDGFDYPFLGGPIRFAWQANYIQTDPYPLILGTDTGLFSTTRDFSSNPRTYSVALAQIYEHPSSTSPENRWSAIDFYNKVIFAQTDIAPQYWTIGTTTATVPGLPVGNTYDGVTAFQNHLILWKDTTLKWSDLNDFSMWIPVTNTIASLTMTTANSFSQPDASASATTPVPPLTGAVYLTEYPDGLTDGQFVKIEENNYYNFYGVIGVTPGAGLSATSVASTQTIGTSTSAGRVFIMAHTDWDVGQIVAIGTSTNYVEIVGVSTATTESYLLEADANLSAGSPNTATVILTGAAENLAVGDYISIGPSEVPGYDIYSITSIATNSTTDSTELAISQTSLGSNQRAAGANAFLAGAVVVPQPWIQCKEYNAAAVTVGTSVAITEKYGVTLEPQYLTGARATSGTVGTGVTITTIDANEAGEAQIVGADDNGKLWAVVPLGDYAVLLKNRAIQVLQYVGRISGTFYVRTEVRNEGLIARNAYVKLNSDKLVFLGNRDLYLYRGGQTPIPICQQYVRQLFQELDRGQLDKIQFLHREARNEVWIVYPISGGQKILIWNYVENSASLDVYPDELLELTALANCRWETDPAWNDLSDQQTWENFTNSITWDSLSGTGSEEVGLVASGDGSLLVHGQVYSHDGVAYTALAETMDYTFNDESLIKHVEGVQVSFQVDERTNVEQKVYVQVGTKMNADGDITWSTARSLDVRGNHQDPTRIPVSQVGRFVRLRFYSEDAEVRWRISGFQIFARAGGVY